MDSPSPDVISTRAAANLIPAASSRQLNDWANRLWLGDHLDGQGSGTYRHWTPIDVLRARALAITSMHLGGSGKSLQHGSLLAPLAERLMAASLDQLVTQVNLHRGPVEIRLRLYLTTDETELAQWITDHTDRCLVGPLS